MAKKTSIDNSILGTGIVEIALIPKFPNTNMESGDDVVLFKGCTREIIPDVDEASVIKQILSPEEEEYLETKLALGKGGLNVHNKGADNFWNTNPSAKLVFTRDNDRLESATLRLDRSKPYDFIKIKIAENHRQVCPAWSRRHENPDWIYSIRTLEAQEDEQTKKVDMEVTVLTYLLANRSSKLKMFNLLRLFNLKASRLLKKLEHSQSAKWMFNQLIEFKDNKKDMKVMYDIISMDEKTRDDKVFLLNAITCGAITTRGPIHMINGGGLLGNSEEEVLNFLAEPKNSNAKLKVQALVNDYIKTIK